MNTREKTVLAVVFTVGLILLAAAGYYLFLGDTSGPDPVEIVSGEQPDEVETLIIKDIEGDRGEFIETAIPKKEEKDIGALFGLVTDADEEPLADADVAVFRSSRPISFISGTVKPLYTTTTDKHGKYRFEPLYTGSGYRLVVKHHEYMHKKLDNIRITQGGDTEAPNIMLIPGKTVTGKVRDMKNHPISGAVIAVLNPVTVSSKGSTGPGDNEPLALTRTNDDGEYSIPNINDSNFKVRASAPGYATQLKRNEQVFTKITVFEFDFHLDKALCIEGVVADEKDNPLPGARVHAHKMKSKNRLQASATTDKKGRFVIESLSEGIYYVAATHELYSTEPMPGVEAGTDNLRFYLPHRSGIAGQVTDSGNVPVASFWLNIERENAPPDGWTQQEMRKKFFHKEGRFVIDGVEPGKYTVEVMASGFAPFKTENIEVIKEVYTSGLSIVLNRGGTLSGCVLSPDSKLLSNVTVRLRRNRYKPNPIEKYFGIIRDNRTPAVQTDKDGLYKIKNIVPGTYQLEFTHKTYPSLHLRDVKVNLDQNTEVPKQWMETGATLQGTVYNETNLALPGVTVNIRKSDTTFHHTETTNAMGFYKITPIPAGIYTVEPLGNIKQTKSPFSMIGSVIRSQVKNVEIFEGEVKELNLVIYD